jgi:hypothetical protein
LVLSSQSFSSSSIHHTSDRECFRYVIRSQKFFRFTRLSGGSVHPLSR